MNGRAVRSIMRILLAAALVVALAAPTAFAAPLPSTCTEYQNLRDVGFCETECVDESGTARSSFNTFFVVVRGAAPCDGSEGYTYAHVIFVVGGVVVAHGSYGDGRQTAFGVFTAGVSPFVDWHEYDGACTTTVGLYDPHGWAYFQHDLGCPVGSAPYSPDPGYGSLVP